MPRTFILLILTGCFSRPSVPCADGRLCPDGTVCDDAHVRCVLPEQLVTCGADPDRTPCELAGATGICHDGVCLAQGCGDGFAEGAEQCDGLDLRGRIDCRDAGFHDATPLACAGDCTLDVARCERRCGDGVVDPEEDCDAQSAAVVADCLDLAYYAAGDVTCNAVCRFDVTSCAGRCGDDIVNGTEVCDGAPPPDQACTDYGFGYGRLGCALCGPAFGGCRRLGWHAGAPIVDVVDIHGARPGDRWFLAETGMLRHERDGMVATHAAPSEQARAVWAFDDRVLVAAGQNVFTLHAGTWTASPMMTALSLWGGAPDDVYAAALEGVFHFDGATWQVLAVQPPGGAPKAITGRDADLWVITDRVYRRDGAGWIAEWQPAGAQPLALAAPPGVDHIVVATRTGAFVTPPLAGPCRSDFAPFISLPIAADLAGPADDLLVLHVDAQFTRNLARWDGLCWRRVDGAAQATLQRPRAIWRDGDAVLYGGERVVSALGTWSWEAALSPILHAGGDFLAATSVAITALEHRWEVVDLAGLPAADGLAATSRDAMWGLDGSVLHTYAGGARSSYATPAEMHAMWPASPSLLWLVGETSATNEARAVWKFEAGTFTRVHAGGAGEAILSDLHVANGAIWSVGQVGSFLRRTGGTWSTLQAPTTSHLAAVWSWGDDDALAVGRAGTIVRYHAGTWTMEASGTIEDLTDVWAVAPDDIFATGRNGTLLHHDGVRWSPVAVPTSADLISVTANANLVIVTDADELSHGLDRYASWEGP